MIPASVLGDSGDRSLECMTVEVGYARKGYESTLVACMWRYTVLDALYQAARQMNADISGPPLRQKCGIEVKSCRVGHTGPRILCDSRNLEWRMP
jgi:hypothetical protein